MSADIDGRESTCVAGFTMTMRVGLIDNRLYRVYEHSTGCQTGLTTGYSKTTRLTTTGCIVYYRVL